MPERRLKSGLLEIAAIGNGFRVLDLGCGTGTLLALAARAHPRAWFTGVDPDPPVLQRARRKLRRAGKSVELELASATALPFRAGSFDRVLSTLMLHHLDAPEKRVALAESFRVLRTGGEIHIADFGTPQGFLTRTASFLVEHLGGEHVRENFRGLLPEMVDAAGFSDVTETRRITTIFGVIRMIRGTKCFRN